MRICRSFVATALAGIAVLGLAGCSEDSPEHRDEPVGATISILELGAIYNITGAQASLDRESWQGAQLAAKQINEAGGVIGHPVELKFLDGDTDTDVLKTGTQDMLADNPRLSAVFGLSDTDMLMASAPLVAESGRLFLTSGATSPKLPAAVPTYLYLACFGDNVQAAAAAEWAYKARGLLHIAVIYDEEMEYTRLLQGYFGARYTELGGQIVAETSFRKDNVSVSADAVAGADAVYLATGPEEAAQAVEMVRALGFEGPIIGGDSFDSPALWVEHRELKDIYYTTHAYLGADNTDSRVISFVAAYRDAYPGEEPTAFAALGFDTVNLLALAVKEAASDEPAEVLEALGKIEGFEGVTGTISYGDGRRIPLKSVSVIAVSEGKLSLAREVMPEKVPAP